MNPLVNDPLIALIDTDDQIIGYAPKMTVHQQGLLHRAFSIFVFDHSGKLLLQQRAMEKYHSPGLWTNTCCGHQNINQELTECINSRLMEEMGITCSQQFLFKFTYQVTFGNGLSEHETDYVYGSLWTGTPLPNPAEAMNYKWMNFDELINDVIENSDKYTFWLKFIISNYSIELKKFIALNTDK